MICCKMDSRSLFLLGSRVLFGTWLLYLGIVKFCLIGATNFIAYISNEFAQSWPPAILITILAWVILLGEPILGILLLIGKKSRCVWMLTALLMFTLMFGQTILQKNDMLAGIWLYTIFALACAALSEPEAAACCAKEH